MPPTMPNAGQISVAPPTNGQTDLTAQDEFNILSVNVLQYIPMSEWQAIYAGTSNYDATADIQRAIDNNPYRLLVLPRGVIRVNANPGIRLARKTAIVGQGRGSSILYALAGGGSIAELAAYSKGSVIGRTFNPSGANGRIEDCYLADFAVVLNHPTSSVTTTAIQIGIDMRNITRSVLNRVWVGNIAPLGSLLAKTDPGAYAVQGYGIVFGTVSAGDAAYAGGEGNIVHDPIVWGTFKPVPCDEATLSPASAAHATQILNADIQRCHSGVTAESQYTLGIVWDFPIIQDIEKQPGNAATSYAVFSASDTAAFRGKYMELGSGVDVICQLAASSKTNSIRLGGFSTTNLAATVFADAGTNNHSFYNKDNGTTPTFINSWGDEVEIYNKAYKRAWARFHWDGAAIVIDGGQGYGTIVRNGLGDYSVTWEKAFPTANYIPTITLDTDVSGNPGSADISAQSGGNCRFFTFRTALAAASVPVQIDPLHVMLQAQQ